MFSWLRITFIYAGFETGDFRFSGSGAKATRNDRLDGIKPQTSAQSQSPLIE
jgi:hypothetical protein